MIIEIRDLPTDRKVKQIHFDITFEEDGTPKVKQTPVYGGPVGPIEGILPGQMPSFGPPHNIPATVTNSSGDHGMPLVTKIPPMPVIQEHREQKDIPPEMRDLEF